MLKTSTTLLLLLLFTTFSPASAEEHSALKPVPRSGGWMTRHEGFNKRVAEGNVDLVFIGDSITQGSVPGPNGGYVVVNETNHVG